MQLIKVESSNVAAIGYLPEVRLLRIAFKDGSTYDYCDISADAYAALMAAPSRGGWIAANLKGGRRLADGGPLPPGVAYLVGETPSEQTIKESFAEDDCCRSRLIKAQRNGTEWVCPKCGVEWRCEMVGEFLHWAPYEAIQVWRS